MSEGLRGERRERADAALAQLVAANPGCSPEADPAAWVLGTNLVTYGSIRGRPVVFKYYDWPPRKDQEERALRLYAPTGLVPALYPLQSDTVLVMERLRGRPLTLAEPDADPELLAQVYYSLGRAMARIVQVAPGSTCAGLAGLSAKPGFDYAYYCRADLGALYDTVTTRAAEVLATGDVPHRASLAASLASLRDHRCAILAPPPFVQMDDFHASNIIVHGPTLSGFVDLEMTRCGNEVTLLGAALAMAGTGRAERWVWMRRGYEDHRGSPIPPELLALAGIAAPFSQWIRFMWYWTGGEFEEGARHWPVRDIVAIIEAVARLAP